MGESVRVMANCGHWVDVWLRSDPREVINPKRIREQENNTCSKCASWFYLKFGERR